MTVMLYRQADVPNEGVWGLPVECEVFDDEDVASQLEDGWFAHPHDIEGLKPEDAAPKRGPGRPRKTEA